uniref:Uncharacterized protein n=1 Tax=Candidatus Methanogaster sp. ANME-2c ERB4 TaxID=2759911 RepID=A0A7G9YBS6_9EURY|nr:hypothetical protein LDPHHAMN_00011 [Methanosarcinales archaeon ANME-2c ERB4]QNO46856.1 hypothetical protein OPEKEIOC_00013 [Methanosarcinales archaeon ANME-2c ERB4]
MWDSGPIAPHAGYITKGDNEITDRQYDQYNRCTEPVREEWIDGVFAFPRAVYRVCAHHALENSW